MTADSLGFATFVRRAGHAEERQKQPADGQLQLASIGSLNGHGQQYIMRFFSIPPRPRFAGADTKIFRANWNQLREEATRLKQ